MELFPCVGDGLVEREEMRAGEAHRATEVAVTGKVKVEVDSLIKLVDVIGRGKLNSERL